MSKPFDYSKWDNIELSDDEDDVHPNIERESWFRMKHRSRVEREEREEADKKKTKGEMEQAGLRIKEIKMELKKIKSATPDPDDSDDEDLEDTEGLEAELKELEEANQKRQKKLDDYEKNKKWNVDNLCKVVEEKTIINPRSSEERFTSSGYALPDDAEGADKKTSTVEKKKAASSKDDKSSKFKETTIHTPVQGPTSDSVAMLSYHEFTEKYAHVMEKFMTLSSLEQSKQYLLLNGNILLQENASNYLLLASLEDEMNGLRVKMKLTARQSQIISNIAELAKTMQRHPGNVIVPFFTRISQKEFYDNFMSGVNAFVEKIIARAVVKKKEMDGERAKEEAEAAEAEEVDLKSIPKEERLGPGGLDPVEVFDSLPKSMQEAFESRDTDKLKAALMAMDMKDAEYHMKRCVNSGLWNES